MSNIIIGNAPYQVPTNADLGSLAFQDADPYLYNASVNVVVQANGTTILDSFTFGQFRTVKYLIQIFNSPSAAVYSSEILFTHDGTNVYWTEYGRLTNQSTNSIYSGLAFTTLGYTITFGYTNNFGDTVTITASKQAINA